MVARARTLESRDVPQVVEFLERDPSSHLGLLVRLSDGPGWFGRLGQVYGYFQGRELVAVCQASHNITVSHASPPALVAFTEKLRYSGGVGSIVGPAEPVLALHGLLAERYGGFWSRPRNIRRAQPLMDWVHPSSVAAESSVRLLTTADYPSYYEASVHMYTHEIGVDPRTYGPSYAAGVKRRLSDGLAYGVVREGAVLFKADLGLVRGRQAQIQGVWMDPRLRGRGLAPAAMTGVLELMRDRYPQVSLYVNDFNAAAIRTYERCGFVQVGTFATVHF